MTAVAAAQEADPGAGPAALSCPGAGPAAPESLPVRPELLAEAPPVHGGCLPAGADADVHADAGGWLDFSANTNAFLEAAFPEPPPLQAWWRAVRLDRYPDPQCRELRALVAVRLGVAAEGIWFGNGASELIATLCLACLRPGDSVLVLEPAFGEYRRAALAAHGSVHFVRAQAGEDLAWDLEAVGQALDRVRPRLVCLSIPNNPSGRYLPRRVLEPMVTGSPPCLWMLDESYAPFAERPESWVDLALGGRVVLVRSLTKLYSVPGLRLGYLVASPAVVRAVRAAQPTWSVSSPAQELGRRLLEQPLRRDALLAELHSARRQLAAALTGLGLRVVPSDANFLLVRVGNASRVAGALRERRLLVRDATSFGLPDCIRVAVRRPSENARLVAALRDVLPERPATARPAGGAAGEAGR